MKRIIVLLMILLCMAGCTKEEPVPVVDPEPIVETPLTDEYVAQMDAYEFMEVYLLGCTGEELDAAAILDRAEKEWGLSFISELRASREYDRLVNQTSESSRGNFVYLFIPAEGVEVTVGSFDAINNDIKRVYFHEENARPFILVGSCEGITPREIVKYVLSDGEEGYMYTGLEAYSGELRTAYRMGLVDMTYYEAFDTSEIALYEQFLFDAMYYSAPELSQKLQDGTFKCSAMDEMLIEGKMYLVYDISYSSSGDHYCLYGVTYDTESNEIGFIQTFDYETWFDPTKTVG